MPPFSEAILTSTMQTFAAAPDALPLVNYCVRVCTSRRFDYLPAAVNRIGSTSAAAAGNGTLVSSCPSSSPSSGRGMGIKSDSHSISLQNHTMQRSAASMVD